MYSNREFFIDMEPAMMELVSAGVNVPTLLRFQVRMSSDDCTVSEAATGDDAALAGEVYRQLRNTLVERGSTTMRGVLVQISPEHKAPYETKRFHSFTYSSTDDLWVRRSFVGKQTNVVLASIIVSYVSAFLLALVSLFFFNRFAMHKMKLLYTQDFVKRQLNMSRLRSQEIEGAKAIGRTLTRQTTRARSFAHKNKEMYSVRVGASNPFQSPLVLTRKLIIEPIRRQYVDSARMFLGENYVITSRVQLPGSSGTMMMMGSRRLSAKSVLPACLLSDVYAQFQWYCMQQDLTAMPRSDFLQYLIAKCELRVKTIWFERIQGLFWLREPGEPSEPLLPGSSRDKVIKAFFETYTNYADNPKTDLVDLTAYPNTPIEDRKDVLLHRLRKFCEESECDVPDDWEDTTTGAPQLCDEIERMFPQLSVVKIQLREVVGLEPRHTQAAGAASRRTLVKPPSSRGVGDDDDDVDHGWFGRGRLGYQFVVIETLTVLTHICVMFFTPCVGLWHAMRIQTVYAETTAMGTPLRNTHILQLPFLIEGKQVMPLAGLYNLRKCN
jgi:hypothetical protein